MIYILESSYFYFAINFSLVNIDEMQINIIKSIWDKETGKKTTHIFECYRSPHNRMNNNKKGIGFWPPFRGAFNVSLSSSWMCVCVCMRTIHMVFHTSRAYFLFKKKSAVFYTLFSIHLVCYHTHYIRFFPLRWLHIKMPWNVCMHDVSVIWFWFPLICHFIFLCFALYHFECRIGIIWREQNKRMIFSMPTQCHDRSLTFFLFRIKSHQIHNAAWIFLMSYIISCHSLYCRTRY